eukprot:2501269-Alexandrium_andersonii.AAC.1
MRGRGHGGPVRALEKVSRRAPRRRSRSARRRPVARAHAAHGRRTGHAGLGRRAANAVGGPGEQAQAPQLRRGA